MEDCCDLLDLRYNNRAEADLIINKVDNKIEVM